MYGHQTTDFIARRFVVDAVGGLIELPWGMILWVGHLVARILEHTSAAFPRVHREDPHAKRTACPVILGGEGPRRSPFCPGSVALVPAPGESKLAFIPDSVATPVPAPTGYTPGVGIHAGGEDKEIREYAPGRNRRSLGFRCGPAIYEAGVSPSW